MSMYRSYGTQAANTPPQPQRAGSSSTGFGYSASPATQQQSSSGSFSGFQSYGGSQTTSPPFNSMQQSIMGYSGGGGAWNAPSSFAGGQMSQAPVSGTPQAPKQFSWGLPIQNYTPKQAGEDPARGSPESPKAMHGTPSHTPNRGTNPLYPSFDADDEAPPRESTLGLDDDDVVSSPLPALPPAPPKPKNDAPQPASYAVIVFGFSPSSQQLVLQAFKAIGEVVDVQAGPHNGSNWVTISYRKQWDASLATRKTGEVIGGTMVGVKWADASMEDAYVAPLPVATSNAPSTEAQKAIMATPNRSSVPLGERINVHSADEALKRPPAGVSPAVGVLARFTGNTTGSAAPTSPHANLFKRPQTPSRGLAHTLSNLVFGE